MNKKILIVDDEKEIVDLLEVYLSNDGYSVYKCYNGLEAMKCIKQSQIDLAILDIMLPDIDGFRLCQKIREKFYFPIIMLTAKIEDSDKIMGLTIGADDYITKPFNPLEAVARVNSNIRRFYSLGTKVVQEGYLSVRDLALNQDACTLKKGDKIIQLTSVEYRIMELFMQHPGKVFTKQQIYEHGWGEEYIVADNNIMVCISKLRAKLDDDPSAYIQTIRGLGYRLEK